MGRAIGLRRLYHRHFGYHARFHIAVLVTILAVAYLLVPTVAGFLTAAGGYDPASYEPKDVARQSWLDSRSAVVGLPGVSWSTATNVGLFLLVVVVWLALGPPGGARRR